MYTKYNDPAANAYAKMCGIKLVNEADEEIQDLDDTGTDEAPEGNDGAEEEIDPLDEAIAEYEAAAEAATEQEDEEGAAKNTQLADWLKELKECRAAVEEVPEEDTAQEVEEAAAKVTESAPCCKKAKVITAKPIGQKISAKKKVNESIDWEKLLGDLRDAREIAINFLEDYVVENGLGEEAEKVYMLLDDLKLGPNSSITTITGPDGILDSMEQAGVSRKTISELMKALLEEVEVVD